MLLLDEIDRADEEFEAFLLEFLSDYQVSIPRSGRSRPSTPVVILTSNRTANSPKRSSAVACTCNSTTRAPRWSWR